MAATAAETIAKVAALVPPPSAFVPELVKAQLPRVIPELQMRRISAEHHLVDLKITGALSDVLKGPIPHRTWIATLQAELTKAQASRRTVTAIKHPTDRELVLPLWALPIWDSIAVACQERMRWTQVMDWLKPGNHRAEDQQSLERVRAILARLPWGLKTWPLPGLDGESLVGYTARFLSPSWLAERNMDLMGVCLNAAVVAGRGKAHSYVAPVYLATQLQGIGDWDTNRILGNRSLCDWNPSQYRYIHIPANLANSHWVVFLVDTERKTYCWGLSLLPTCGDSSH